MSTENRTYTVCATKKYKKSVCLVYNLTLGFESCVKITCTKKQQVLKINNYSCLSFSSDTSKAAGSRLYTKDIDKNHCLAAHSHSQGLKAIFSDMHTRFCHDTPGFGSSEPGPSFQLLQLSTYIDLLPWYLNPLGTIIFQHAVTPHVEKYCRGAHIIVKVHIKVKNTILSKI